MRTFLFAVFLALCSLPGLALALTQPNGPTIPTGAGCNAGQPTGLAAAFACACDRAGVCNIGAPCASQTSCDNGHHATCETTMAHAFNDNTCIPSLVSGLDPVADAAVTPETFHPSCPLTFTVLTRGTALFHDGFGWYNVTGQKPQSSELHQMIGCDDPAGKAVVLDIASDPNYRGGDVGFFIVTAESHTQPGSCANGDCCSKVSRLDNGEGYAFYSERKFNPDQQGADSLIHLLVYDSHIRPRRFYFAWEDRFGGVDNGFTDLVTSVDGVECSGGGALCDTGKKGICGHGVGACRNGVLGCVPILEPTPEACDGLDNDCNGRVDDGATCPAPTDVCANGKCVHACNGVEFPCTGNTTCDTTSRLCVDAACIGITCAADQVCRGGKCAAACEGVSCPVGQTCTGNACIDLCKGKTCAAGQVCREGVCFAGCATCGGMACAAPAKCEASSGKCVDPGCAGGCGPGLACVDSRCQDGCTGVTCPAGQACSKGECSEGTGTTDNPGPQLSNPVGGDNPSPGASGGEVDGGVAAEEPTSAGHERTGGCACRVPTATAPGGDRWRHLIAGLLVLRLIVRWRRRRRMLLAGEPGCPKSEGPIPPM